MKFSRCEEGLTLLEVVLSIALLGIVFLAFTQLLTEGFSAFMQAGRISQATALAQEKMEELRAFSYSELLDLAAQINGGSFSCPDTACSPPEVVPGFTQFQRSYFITCDQLEFDGYAVPGLRLEVVILQGEERQVARLTSFVRQE